MAIPNTHQAILNTHFPKGYTKYLYGSEREFELVLGEGLLRKSNIQVVELVYGGSVCSTRILKFFLFKFLWAKNGDFLHITMI